MQGFHQYQSPGGAWILRKKPRVHLNIKKEGKIMLIDYLLCGGGGSFTNIILPHDNLRKEVFK